MCCGIFNDISLHTHTKKVLETRKNASSSSLSFTKYTHTLFYMWIHSINSFWIVDLVLFCVPPSLSCSNNQLKREQKQRQNIHFVHQSHMHTHHVFECGKIRFRGSARRAFSFCAVCVCGLFLIFKHELVAFLIRILSHPIP